MKIKQLISRIMLLGAGSLTLAACNDFLDELPDNRTELDTPDKINRLLVSAYPSRSFTRMCEIASDNCDDMGANNPNTSLLLEHNSYWMEQQKYLAGLLLRDCRSQHRSGSDRKTGYAQRIASGQSRGPALPGLFAFLPHDALLSPLSS